MQEYFFMRIWKSVTYIQGYALNQFRQNTIIQNRQDLANFTIPLYESEWNTSSKASLCLLYELAS